MNRKERGNKDFLSMQCSISAIKIKTGKQRIKIKKTLNLLDIPQTL
jgi:hypothetical protein